MTQLLIYKSAVAVSRARHGDCHVQSGGNYAFTADINSVPLMAVEFPQAANEYAIVFAGPPGEITPAVILGVRGNENLYLPRGGPQGGDGWAAKYVPAFIRRYPFVFSQSDDRFVLCVDEEFPGLNRTGQGQALFLADGTPSPYVDEVLKFLQEYQAQFLRTQAFCNKLAELDVLEPMQAQVTMGGGDGAGEGASVSLGGFMAVNRARLKALSGEKMAELAATDELELIYLHLQSMRNFEGLKDRLEQAVQGAAATATSNEPDAGPVPGEQDAGTGAASVH